MSKHAALCSVRTSAPAELGTSFSVRALASNGVSLLIAPERAADCNCELANSEIEAPTPPQLLALRIGNFVVKHHQRSVTIWTQYQ